MQQWDELWVHAQIATMEGDSYGMIDDGAIAIRNGAVAWLGKTDDMPSHQVEEVTDTHGALITPGLIDCHTHIVYAGNRSDEFEARLAGKTYEQIAKEGGGIQSTVMATRFASEDDLFEQSMLRAEAMLANGVRCIEVKSGYGLDLENELKMLRVARRLEDELGIMVCPTFLGAHCVPLEYADQSDAYIDYVCNVMMPEIASQGLAEAVDGFCESMAFTPAQIEKVFAAAKRWNLPVKLHAEQLSNQGGAKLAAKYNALSCDHLEYLDEDGAKAMSEAGTVAVLLPGAYYFLKETKKPPIDLLRKYNIPMAIATDSNPGSSPTTSLSFMMNMACTLFGLTVEEAIKGVTTNAAKALGLPVSQGQIIVDDPINFVIWDVKSPAQLVCEF